MANFQYILMWSFPVGTNAWEELWDISNSPSHWILYGYAFKKILEVGVTHMHKNVNKSLIWKYLKTRSCYYAIYATQFASVKHICN